MRSKVVVWLLAAFVFVLGNVTGLAVARAIGARQLDQLFRPDGLARHRVLQRVLTKQLGLDAAQEAHLAGILTRQDPTYIAILKEREPDLVELREEIVRELGPSLNDAQSKKLRELMVAASLRTP